MTLLAVMTEKSVARAEQTATAATLPATIPAALRHLAIAASVEEMIVSCFSCKRDNLAVCFTENFQISYVFYIIYASNMNIYYYIVSIDCRCYQIYSNYMNYTSKNN